MESTYPTPAQAYDQIDEYDEYNLFKDNVSNREDNLHPGLRTT